MTLFHCALRYVAGQYWIIRIDQNINEYIAPVKVNECGADIFQSLNDGRTVDQTVEKLCLDYGIEKEQAQQDVTQFIHQLAKSHILSI